MKNATRSEQKNLRLDKVYITEKPITYLNPILIFLFINF